MRRDYLDVPQRSELSERSMQLGLGKLRQFAPYFREGFPLVNQCQQLFQIVPEDAVRGFGFGLAAIRPAVDRVVCPVLRLSSIELWHEWGCLSSARSAPSRDPCAGDSIPKRFTNPLS